MTKNRARKHAARQRAALTGERYVVAQRATAERLPHRVGRLDALTHRVPGVPAHIDGGLQGVAGRRGSRSGSGTVTRRRNARHGEPRVLVAWQNWIARHLSVRSH